MNSKHTHINCWSKASAVLLVVILTWLTVSMPFVLDMKLKLQKAQVANNTSSAPAGKSSALNNLLAIPSEEKTETVSDSFSEYLHHAEAENHSLHIPVVYHFSPSTALYIAFHGELLTPPPNAIV